MDDNIHLQDQEEAEEAISLSEYPLNSTDEPHRDRRSSSEPTDVFEFFSDLTPEMSHAEDIIFCGKLVPFKNQTPSNQNHNPTTTTTSRDQHVQHSFHRRRSESLPLLNTSRSSTCTNTQLIMRNSRSLDYKKLRRNSSLTSETSESHGNSSGRCDVYGVKIPKPRWCILMFGLVKFPQEMHLRDIKNRQVRRNPSTLFPSHDTGKTVAVNRSDRKSTWGILNLLSCKDDASVAVTTSLGYVQNV